MNEEVIYSRLGRAVFRLCGQAVYDYAGKPRGVMVGQTLYDCRGQHRGFILERVVRDRTGRVVGFMEDAAVQGLTLPPAEVPPVPYKNLPAPDPPASAVEVGCPPRIPQWSIMRLENLLVP